MSIEVDLNRIATALEELVKIGRGGVAPAIAASTAAPKGPKTPTPAAQVVSMGKPAIQPKAVPVAAPVVDTDPLTGAPVTQAEPPTQDAVHQVLQGFMEKNGVEAVKGLMIKYGANKVKPTLTSIPPANYAAVIAEANA